MPSGTTIAATATASALNVTLDRGSTVPRISETSTASLSFAFEAATTSGPTTVTLTSPSGTTSSVAIPVDRGNRPSVCPP